MSSNTFRQIRETDPVKHVVTVGPNAAVRVGAFHPSGSLFEGSININETLQSHQQLKESLAKLNIEVKEIQESFETLPVERLRVLAGSCLNYSGHFSDRDLEIALSNMSKHQLVEMLILNPQVHLKKTAINTQIEISSIELSPVPNLMFTRDQQITTNCGVILGSMRAEIRQKEKKVMKAFFEEVIQVPVFELLAEEGAFLEGGDFFPMGSNISMIGIGPRSNIEAVYQIMLANKFGTPYVVVVKDLFDRDQQRMHLDTIFNVITAKTVVVLDNLTGMRQRLVDIYYRDPDSHVYSKKFYDIDFYVFLEKWLGLNLIKVTEQQQKDYAINFVNLGNNSLLVANADAGNHFKETLKTLEGIDLNIIALDYRGVTAMFGGPHCSTQVARVGNEVEPDDPKLIFEDPAHIYPPETPKNARQSADTVLMIPPTAFAYNPETALDNPFMNQPPSSPQSFHRSSSFGSASSPLPSPSLQDSDSPPKRIPLPPFSRPINEYPNQPAVNSPNQNAMTEFCQLRAKLIEHGVRVVTPINDDKRTLDAVFPNNWFSTHPATEAKSGKDTMVLYPMKTHNRRLERKPHIIKELHQKYDLIDLSYAEVWGSRLEGTGVLVLDRVNKVAFSVRSERSTDTALRDFGKQLGYKVLGFRTASPIYHTNIMMSIGTEWVVVCTDLIHPEDREQVLSMLKECKKEIIDVTRTQIDAYCGNIIELCSVDNKRLVLCSNTAFAAFTPEQQSLFKKFGVDEFVVSNFDEIQFVGGGGVRCSVAEIF